MHCFIFYPILISRTVRQQFCLVLNLKLSNKLPSLIFISSAFFSFCSQSLNSLSLSFCRFCVRLNFVSCIHKIFVSTNREYLYFFCNVATIQLLVIEVFQLENNEVFFIVPEVFRVILPSNFEFSFCLYTLVEIA